MFKNIYLMLVVVIFILTASVANSATVNWYWMSPTYGTITEVVRYKVDLGSETWIDDVKLINQEISRAALNNRFSNFSQLESLINSYLKNENLGNSFRVTDVERVDLLNP